MHNSRLLRGSDEEEVMAISLREHDQIEERLFAWSWMDSRLRGNDETYASVSARGSKMERGA